MKKHLILFFGGEGETLDAQKWLVDHACLSTSSGVGSFKSNSFPSGCQTHRAGREGEARDLEGQAGARVLGQGVGYLLEPIP